MLIKCVETRYLNKTLHLKNNEKLVLCALIFTHHYNTKLAEDSSDMN